MRALTVASVLAFALCGCGGDGSTNTGTGSTNPTDATDNTDATDSTDTTDTTGTTDTTDVTDNTECTPSCDGKDCGDDGCGGTCGECTGPGESCTGEGKCEVVCQPFCEGKDCGDDGCGGSCGDCDAGMACSAAGKCEGACAGKVCGPDGAGGSCGECPADQVCDAAGQCGAAPACGTCAEGTVCGAGADQGINPQWCVGEDCAGVTYAGECTEGGAVVMFCDQGLLFSIDCATLSDGANACGFSEANDYFDCLPAANCGDKVCGPDGAGGSCGECGMDEACNADGQCEECLWQCEGKGCGDNGCGGVCGTCDEGTLCDAESACVDPATIPGNTCETAIAVAEAPTELTGSTEFATNETGTEAEQCEGIGAVGGGSNDHIYAFTPTETAKYEITLTGFDSALYVTTACGDSTTCLGGDEQIGGTATETVNLSLEAGTAYYIVVDGWNNGGNAAGAYTLNIGAACFPSCTDKVCGTDGCGGSCGTCEDGNLCEADGTCVPAAEVTGNLCGKTFAIDAVPYTTAGDTNNATANYGIGADSCIDASGGASNEQIYSFTPAADALYSFAVTDAAWSYAVYVTEACPALPDGVSSLSVACTGGAVGGTAYVSLTGGTDYWVFVDGASNDENVNGSYTLTVDTCVPDCTDKNCGTDGCGGDCGECPEGEFCSADQVCGPPTCAGSCGAQSESGCWCDDGCFGFGDCCTDICDHCEEDYKEQCDCTPDCTDKACGSDGCFGSCGECAEGETCNDEAGTCSAETCDGSCTGQSPAGCWCDDQCFGFGDCCADICDFCDSDYPEQCAAP